MEHLIFHTQQIQIKQLEYFLVLLLISLADLRNLKYLGNAYKYIRLNGVNSNIVYGTSVEAVCYKKRTSPATCKEGVKPCKGLTLVAFDKVNLHMVRLQNLLKVNTTSIIIRYFSRS